MKTNARPRERIFAPGTSRKREGGVTLRLDVARDQEQLLAMGARIKELREASGLRQQYIADQCGVVLRTYQFWQAGASPPSQDNLEKLAELFNVTTRYILRGDTPQLLADRGDQLDRIEQNQAIILGVLEKQVGSQILEAVRKDMKQARPSAASKRQTQAA